MTRGAGQQLVVPLGNLLGGLLVFFYFRFIDTVASELPVGRAELIFFASAFVLIAGAGTTIIHLWIRPLTRALRTGEGRADPDVRRRALLFPWMVAGVTAAGWVMAGLTWGLVWPMATGTFNPRPALRLVFGIIGVGGTVVTALIFFVAVRVKGKSDEVEVFRLA